MTDKGYGYEITPCTAKPAVTIPGSHGTKGSENKIDFGSSKLSGKSMQTKPTSGSQTPNAHAWWKKDSEVKYHKYS